MYYPKSQIQTGFYSNNDLAISSTQTSYVGPYFKTSDGNFYTGKEPNDGPNQLLISLSESNTIINNINPIKNRVEDLRFKGANVIYSTLIEASKNDLPYTPIPYFPILTQDDINNGEFVRYFAKKSNQNLYTEIDGNNFSESVSSNLYITFQLVWVISGEKETVKQINAKQVAFVEKNLQIMGLGEYLKFNYLQFYQE